MKHIGFYGGSSVIELGEPYEMSDFFKVLSLAIQSDSERFLLERLYRRYIYWKDLDKTSLLFNELKENISGHNHDKYKKYFEGVEHCIQSAKGFYDDWGKYKAVKIVCTDMPYFMVDRDRPLEEYDALAFNDIPFWLR